MYGWNYPWARQNPVTWVLEAMGRGKPVPVVTDVSENPLFYHQAGEALWKLVRRRDLRLVHLGGGKTVNRYQFALEVARTFGLDSRLIHPVDSTFFPELVPRPRNTSYATDLMEKELGIQPFPIEQGLQYMKEHGNSQK
jgi:dTDP-4-dehydrorhamnose reductase